MYTKKLSRREFLKTSAVSGASLAAAASGLRMAGAASRARRRQAQTTITIVDPWAGTSFGDAHLAQQQRFMDSHPNIAVESSTIPFSDFRTMLVQGAAAGELPDICIIDNPDFHGFAALGVLADLTDQIESWGETDLYFPGHWATTVFQGANYGVPCFSNCLAWWMNSDMQAAAGIETPTTWEELAAAAQALTDGDRFGVVMDADHSEEGVFQWLAFLWSTGSDLATINDEGGQKALQLWVDLVNNGSMSQGILGWNQWAVKEEFGNQRAAMMLAGPWFIPEMNDNYPDVKWEVSAIPKDQMFTSILGGENYGVTIDSPNIDAAWEYIAWTQEPENYAMFIQELGMFPSRSDVAEDPYWTEDPVLSIFLEAVKVARARAYGAHYLEMSNAIQDAMQAAISGQSSVKDALDQAAETITPLLPPTLS
jgi:multiple sugar transport system substrate-binding protein